ncbi:hypothetical protein TKK_0011768 [Trichogramma kaykai]
MTRRDLHLFAIGESWLKPRMHSGPFEVTGYTLFRHDRVGAGAGGVALYVRDGLRCRCVAFSERPPIYRNRPEFMFVQVRVESSSVLVCAVYNPPKAGYWSDLEEALLNCRVTYDYAILCGDLNINWPVLSNPRATLRDFFVSYDFTPLPFGTTHHPGDTHTTIDYIYVRGLQALDTDKKHHLYISKHDALFATLPIDVPPPVGANIRCRDFKRLDQRRFDAELFSIDWAHIIGLVNVDAKRNRAWRRYRRLGRRDDLEAFRGFRGRLRTATRRARAAFFRGRIASCNDSSTAWRIVGELGIGSRARDSFALPIDVDTLNEHFVGVAGDSGLRDSRQTARIAPEDRFYFSCVTELDVLEAVRRGRSNARGVDDISLRQLAVCLHRILPVLCDIFNASLQSGVFPSLWKSALVRPLAKRKPPLDVGHLRPISLLCAASKLLEYVALKQMKAFISERGILDDHQSGFREHHSTHTALIDMVDGVRAAVEDKDVVLMVTIDFSRAFDLVDIDLLIDRLRSYGFSDQACSWIQSFLSHRPQIVLGPQGERSSQLHRQTPPIR